VHIIKDERGSEYYGFVSVKLKRNTTWMDLVSLIPGKITTFGIIASVIDIFIGINKNKVEFSEVIPNNPDIVWAVVTFSMLYVAC
jgi:hypothetical protein